MGIFRLSRSPRRRSIASAAAGVAGLFAVALALAVFAPGRAPQVYAAGARHARDGGSHGKHSSATVSFGSWMTTPLLDRFPSFSPIAANHHQLMPNEVTIHCGGTVNFIIAGFHLVLVYGDGTQPGDINPNITVPPTNQPVPPLINDLNNRIYRGLDPSTQPRDRVEVVHFEHPGTYLVACGVRPHFLEGMIGFVTVLPCEDDDHDDDDDD